MKKQIKNIVGSGIILGVGSTALGAMGQGSIATKTITPAANMLGVASTVGMGMGIMNMANNSTKRRRRRKWNLAKAENM